MCNSQVEEKMLMSIFLLTHTVGKDIFSLIDLYMAENGFCLKVCFDICTNGAQSLFR
jgi:hypothetical protein